MTMTNIVMMISETLRNTLGKASANISIDTFKFSRYAQGATKQATHTIRYFASSSVQARESFNT